ncbi:tetratricopeptide repeat protein [Geomicrobium sediminis]|uniref:Tetratricopeptide (TPR) repeat protein n=1 Tax=Geomicrobium sediminis TaxID=1347788 RepID=A0ABS2PEX0_9BACL|nr:tetratricopeptide repeat protein [Geomicrobium sediminis]MBM7633516.1 tetratricopeptide (TPR) repeat protein [Geomicrobium sediminis]
MQEQLMEAVQLIEEGDVERGLTILNALENHEDDDTQFQVAAIYQELGHAEKSMTIIDELLVKFPNEGSLLTLKAEAAIDLDEEETAITSLENIDQRDHAYVEAQMLLADLYQLQGLEEVAEQKLFKAMEVAPKEPVLLAGIGSYYVEQGSYQKAIPYLKQAIEHGFSSEEANMNLLLAESYSNTGEWETALNYYEDAVDERAEPRALFGYGFTALQAGMTETAIEQLEALRAKDPAFTSLYVPLIEAYEQEGNADKALELTRAGLVQDEENEQLYLKQGHLNQTTGATDEATRAFLRVLDLNPANHKAASQLLELYYEQEDADEIMTLLDRLKTSGEEDPLFLYYEGKAKQLDDDVEGALLLFEQVQEYLSSDGLAMEEYGYLLLENGKREEAMTAFKRALALQEDNQQLRMYVHSLQEEEW